MKVHRRTKWILLVLGALVLVTVGTATGKLALAGLLAERRPALLRDAEWHDPASAHLFAERFPPGTAETELLAWLNDNRFAVDPRTRRATRDVGGFACNERIEVAWTADAGGRLARAAATVFEAGCL